MSQTPAARENPRVLITRPEPDAGAFAALCREAGFEPLIAPLMEVNIHKKDAALDNIAALAFTSANGVRAFAANSLQRSLPVFAVGPATAKAAKEARFEEIEIAEGDVKTLASLIKGRSGTISGDVLHIAGAHRAGDLAGLLEQGGVPCRRAVLYEAKAAEDLPRAAQEALSADPSAEWAVFFSPRTARLFTALCEKAGLSARLGAVKAACLSVAVAAELSKDDWRSVEIASEPQAVAVISLMSAR